MFWSLVASICLQWVGACWRITQGVFSIARKHDDGWTKHHPEDSPLNNRKVYSAPTEPKTISKTAIIQYYIYRNSTPQKSTTQPTKKKSTGTTVQLNLAIYPATCGIKFPPQQHHMAQGVYLSQVHRDPRVLLRADWAPAGHEEPVHGPCRGEVGGEIGGRNGQAVQGQVLLQNGVIPKSPWVS